MSEQAPDPFSMTADQATAALAEKSAAYQASLVPAGAVAPPPPGRPATNAAEAAARLSQLRADPQWRDKLLTGSATQVREFQELTALAAGGGVAGEHLIETVDAVSDPSALPRSAYEGLLGGLREGGMNEIAENYIRDLDSGARTDRGTEGDKIAVKAFRDRLMKSSDLREKYLNGSSPKLTSLMNALNRVIALCADDGRPISAEGREILAELEKLH